MLSYPQRDESKGAPWVSDFTKMKNLVSRDLQRGYGLEAIRGALVAAGWKWQAPSPWEDIPINEILRDGQEIAAKLPKETKEEIAQHATRMMLSSMLGKPFVAEGSVEPVLVEFMGMLLRRLPDEDLKKVRAELSEMPPTIRGKGLVEREYREYIGVPNFLVPRVKRIYFQYPESKFPEVATMFHTWGVPLTVRPKSPARKDSRVGRGLAPDLWGISAEITVHMPEDRGEVSAINTVLDVSGYGAGETFTINNTAAAMSILLMFNYGQEDTYGPQWESPEEKRAMYEKHGLLHLLIDLQ